MSPGYDVVIPTVGRPSLRRLLVTLAGQHACARHPRPRSVVVVDDRAEPGAPLDVAGLPFPVGVRRSGGRGPAAARNVGWRCTSAPWVVFLDDDVELPAGWSRRLAEDLLAADADPDVAGSQARLLVPLPADRRPTDWERTTAGLAGARWITADMVYRRTALMQVAGFDERFPRAYREDADLALRVRAAGWRLAAGTRQTIHPVRPANRWVSLRAQAGAADDALMRRLHGRRWRRRADAGRGRFPAHLATVLSALVAGAAAAAGRRRIGAVALTLSLALTVDFAARRIAPGPDLRTAAGRAEAGDMLLTSPLIPALAVGHRLRGRWRHRRAGGWPVPVRAVLFDRDGTLVHDVPYNGDPALVTPVPDAGPAVDRLRRSAVRVAVVSNQSGVGRGRLTPAAVAAVNRRIDELVGPFDTWRICPHAPDAGCRCRKPEPGLILDAARDLGVAPFECAVVGDIGADVDAAIAAGARPYLVPTGVTRADEISRAPAVADSLTAAVDRIVTGPTRRP